jgi:hypothetical protein
VDQLAHGSTNLHGWGQTVRPNTTLLSVRGFDPAANRFIYTVNERFGATSASTNAIRMPFQVGIQLRYTLGQSGFLGAFGGGFGGGRGGAGGREGAGRGAGGGGAGDFTNRFASLIPNPIKEMLDLRIGLRLTDDQEARLKQVSDTVVAQNTALAKALQSEMAKMGANPDGARMMSVVRPKLEEARKRMQAALDAAKAILTPEQWNYLPERLKNPRDGFQGGQRRAPPGSE